MTRYLAVTTCNAKQWEQYGRAMVRTFLRHWPAEVELRLYPEGFTGSYATDLHTAAPWLVEFKRKHQPAKGQYNRLDYRRDACRFAHKVAAIWAASESAECDVLIWLDADIVTFSDVTVDWLDSLFPPPATVAWLDRTVTYPECGFLMFRMPEARKVIGEVVQMYTSGKIFKLPETHDSYVFQHVVGAAESRGEIKVHSLSGEEGRKHVGHPFANSPISCKMDHLKGDIRKQLGRTPKEQRHIKDDIAYWR
jgi:hypothetical protein